MPQVVAFEDAKADQLKNEHNTKTPFIKLSGSAIAYLIKEDPYKITKPHFHEVDQFQIVVEGKAKFGRHEVAPYTIHFSRAYTPYGPLLPAKETGGWAFITLRARPDSGAQFFPESKQKLRQLPHRSPWQLSRQVRFSMPAKAAPIDSVIVEPVSDMQDDAGMFASLLIMAPNTKTLVPEPARGDGQYLVILQGSMSYGDKEHKAYTIVLVEPKEGAFELQAGPEGLQAIIVNFPEVKSSMPIKGTSTSTAGCRQWQCEFCSFAYDEAQGLPEDGIATGTRWEDIPDTWSCPDCGVPKSDFRRVDP